MGGADVFYDCMAVTECRKSESKGHFVKMKDWTDPKMDRLRNHIGVC